MKINTPCIDLCTGFLQSTRKANGMDVLADKLHAIEGLRVGRPMPWDSDPIGNANWVLRNVHFGVPYFVAAYSYGANTALEMCRHLKKRGRVVDGLYLIDGVKRIRTAKFSWAARAWSINPWLKLIVPASVEDCVSWRQDTGQPKGHRVYHNSDLVNSIFIKVPHTQMEDQLDIHDRIKIDVDASVTSYRRSRRGK